MLSLAIVPPIPHLDCTFSSKKRKRDQNHKNELEGITDAMQSAKRGKHTAVTLLRADKNAITARNLSELGIYCRTEKLDADLIDATALCFQGVLACQRPRRRSAPR